MRLAEYLAKHGVKPSEFAKQIEASPSTVTRYVRGERIPRLGPMRKIEAVTGGAVTADDFLDAPGRVA